jgi:hypothetical protein
MKLFPQKHTLLAMVQSPQLIDLVNRVGAAIDNGAHGVIVKFNAPVSQMTPFLGELRRVRAELKDIWLGVDLAAVLPKLVFPLIANDGLDGVFIEQPGVDERLPVTRQQLPYTLNQIRQRAKFDGLFLGGVGYNSQRPIEPDYFRAAAACAKPFLDCIVTDGPIIGTTGVKQKVLDMKEAAGETYPIAVSRGLDDLNIQQFFGLADIFIIEDFVSLPRLTVVPGRIRKMADIVSKANIAWR